MAFSTQYIDRDKYLEIKISGCPTYAEILEFWVSVVDHCQTTESRRLLILAELDNELESFSTAENYQIASRLPQLGFPQKTRIAILYKHDRFFHTDKFGETVARNRGLNVLIFQDTENALLWLLEDSN